METPKASRRKALMRRAGLWLLLGLVGMLRILPLPAALALGRGIGSLIRLFSKKRYRVALKNLQIAYGDSLTEAERRRIARESFRQFGMFAVETIKFAFLSQEEVDRRVRFTHPEALQEALQAGRGVLLISGHFGGFEVAGRWLTGRDCELYALAREARDPGTTALMTRMRQRCKIKVITLRQSLKAVYGALKRNAFVAIICDQNASDVFVPFFGHPTGTVDGPARLARRTNTPMIFFVTRREARCRYVIEYRGTYWPQPTDDEQADVLRIMTEVNRQLEAMIREKPEQWLWFHDRWKSSPIGRTDSDRPDLSTADTQ
jgi:KDO2-lipid IV(A) lauroyltransferase